MKIKSNDLGGGWGEVLTCFKDIAADRMLECCQLLVESCCREVLAPRELRGLCNPFCVTLSGEDLRPVAGENLIIEGGCR